MRFLVDHKFESVESAKFDSVKTRQSIRSASVVEFKMD